MKKFVILPLLSAFTFLGSCANKVDQSILTSGIDMVEIIFDAKAGVFEDTGLHAKSIRVRKSYTWKIVKRIAPSGANIKYGDYTFVQWLNGDQAISDSFAFTAPTTVLTAEYSGVEKVVLTLDPGEGYWDEAFSDNEPRKLEVPVGSTWGEYYQSYNELYHRDVLETEYQFIGFFTQGSIDPPVDPEQVTTDYPIEQATTFIAHYAPIGTCADFTTDSWAIFNEAISQGFEFISTTPRASGGYQEDFTGNGGTFVGLTRKIHFYNSDYTVRVIDENKDALSDGSGNAALTFEFVDAIDNGVGWNSTPSILYNGATIRDYLNNQFINALPSDFVTGLAEVNKRTYSGDETIPMEERVKYFPETVFLPSLNEIGITQIHVQGLPAITPKDEGFNDLDPEHLHEDYDLPYDYYSDAHVHDLKKYYYINHNFESTRAYTNYWVRSTDYDSTAYAWYINNNGVVSPTGSQAVNIGLAISPCFAMGGASV